MHLLTTPLTVEDWQGQTFLLVPRRLWQEGRRPGDGERTMTVFRAPELKESKSKSIRRILVGEEVGQATAEGLGRTVRDQLGLDLDLGKMRVFRMGPGGCRASREGLAEISSYDSVLDNNNYENISENNDEVLSKLSKSSNVQMSSNVDRNSNSSYYGSFPSELKNNYKFTFFTCWCMNDILGENYFLLPNDNIDNLVRISKESNTRIRNANKDNLEKAIKCVENETECRIKFRPIIQSRRVSQLLYRKVIIYSNDKTSTLNILNILNKKIKNIIKNSVFYQPLPKSTDLVEYKYLSKFKSHNGNLNYAQEQLLDENIFTEMFTSKLSKIPIPYKNNRHKKQLTEEIKQINDKKKLSLQSNIGTLMKINFENNEISDISETIRASLLI